MSATSQWRECRAGSCQRCGILGCSDSKGERGRTAAEGVSYSFLLHTNLICHLPFVFIQGWDQGEGIAIRLIISYTHVAQANTIHTKSQIHTFSHTLYILWEKSLMLTGHTLKCDPRWSDVSCSFQLPFVMCLFSVIWYSISAHNTQSWY